MTQHIRTLTTNMFREDDKKSYRLTPFIVTLCNTTITSIDMENFLEMGLRIIRFKLTNLTRSDKIMMLVRFKQAMKLFCEKFDVTSWPIAICVDLPNACIKTGCFSVVQEINNAKIYFEKDNIIEITCNPKFWNKCTKNRLYMDDPLTFKLIKPGTEITVGCGKVILNCVEVLNERTIKCKTIQGGSLGNVEFFCVRGIKHLKPPFSKYDLGLIEFAKEYELNIIIINSVRRKSTLEKIKALFKNCPMPYIVSTICEQEGLDNIDSIIEGSDGVILAREFLAYEIINKYEMPAIQKQVCAKCRQHGKAFFISGSILEESVQKGLLLDRDVADITNAAIDGSGFVLRHIENPTDILIAMNVLDALCKSVESLKREGDFWRVLDEVRMPVNAAEACCLACVLAAKQTNSRVIIVPTVSGSTARLLSHVAPEVIILSITPNPFTARKLQLYRGVIPIIYNVKSKQDFEDEMDTRVAYAVGYCVKYNILNYMETYVLLRRTSMYSAFADHLSAYLDFGASDHGKTGSLITEKGDSSLTTIDIENFIEMGLRIIRFKMTKLSVSDKIVLLAKFKQAMKLFCEKYDVQTWPIATCIDLPNACIKTGCLNEEIGELDIMLEENAIINVTCNKKSWNKCTKDLLYMDDPYTFILIKPGTEITIGCGKVIMICTEVIDEQTIKCRITHGGLISNVEFFCIRGIKHTKPPISKYDRKMIEFAKEYKLDIIIMNSVRYGSTLDKVKAYFQHHPMPLIISTICEQEGLDNIDDIIEKSDGIILAREFLAFEILNKYHMKGIQMQVGAKCKQRGKPFFVSGNILEDSLGKGIITDQDLFDISNAAMEGTGFVLRELIDPSKLLIAMNVLDYICKSVESVNREVDFWRIIDEVKMPANAAAACCIACALATKQSSSKVIIVPTVTGGTPRRLTQVAPEAVILSISSSPAIARKLQLFRGIISIIYKVKVGRSFEEEINARVDSAVEYCIRHNILKYKETYVLLRRANICSAFPDSVSVCTVHTQIHATIEC